MSFWVFETVCVRKCNRITGNGSMLRTQQRQVPIGMPSNITISMPFSVAAEICLVCTRIFFYFCLCVCVCFSSHMCTLVTAMLVCAPFMCARLHRVAIHRSARIHGIRPLRITAKLTQCVERTFPTIWESCGIAQKIAAMERHAYAYASACTQEVEAARINEPHNRANMRWQHTCIDTRPDHG